MPATLYTKASAIASLRDCVETVYVIECSRCSVKFEQSFPTTPKGQGDLSYTAQMAYDQGWIIGGGVHNGDFTLFPLCPACVKHI